MAKKITIPQQNQPFRRQSSLGGNVSFRNLGGTDNNNYVVMAVVTKVYYKQGRVDFRLTNSTNHVVTETGDGIGSAPIPVDFYGYQRDGKIFGHYRPIQIGDLIAVAYLWGHKQAPIVLGVYPKDSSSYEFVAPQEASSSGDDKDEAIYDYALGDQKIFPDGSLEYHSGNGKYFKTLRGKSFMLLDDSPLYEHLWVGYNDIGAFKDSDQNTINPLQEEAGDWLLVHEDNNESSNSTDHRTRFYVSKDGTFQVVLSKSSKLDNLVIIEGSKSNGFTLQELYDVPQKGWIGENDPHKEPDIKNAQQYVKFNLGGQDRSATVEAATKNDSVEQATKLKIKDDGIYVNGKVLVSSNPKYTGKTILDDTINNSEGLNDAINKVQDAVEQARQAGEAAKEAGLSAEAAGESAKNIGDDIKKNIIYYASISKEKDVSIPGKYIIVNTDTYIAKGTIKNAYIEDGAIDQAKIADAAIDSAQIKNGAITTAKIADLAVGSAQIEDLAVTDGKVGKLTFDHMDGATLDADKIKVINLTADNIKVHSISADILNIGQLSDITGDIGKITKGHIQAGDDSNSGVKIDGLDADNPNKYTPSKKAFLLSEVKKLNSAAEAAIDYGKSTGVDATSVENAKEAMDNGLASLLGNLTETTEFDYNTVIKLEQDLQNAINAFHNNANSDIIAQIGTTANGKNAIYRGANEPQNPHTNDVWLQILNDGTYNIRVWDGGTWINPGLADIKAVENSLSNLPKSYYQAEEPVGDSVHDGDTWYKLTKGSDGKYTYVAYKREGNSWTPLLNAGEVSNQSSINTLQSDLEQARKLIEDDGGGINLYTGTEDFSNVAGRSWFHRNDANWTLTDRRDPNGNLEMKKNDDAWGGLGQAITVEPGKYTFSCYLWVHLTGNETLNFYAGDSQYGGTATVGATNGTTQFTANDSDKYIHVTITYNVTKGGILVIRPELNQDSGTFWVSSYKLEKGSQATPWCRNGNDYMAGIAAVQEDVNSATAAIQQAKTNAANDAAKIRADVARIESEVASAKSASQDSINALQSDIDAAKKDLADSQSGLLNAQSAIEQNQKLINDSVAKINNDINQDRKDIAAAQQANTDTANKLDSYTKQATEQGNSIKELQTDNDSTKLTIADIKGNVSQVQSSVTGLTANLKDTNDNLAAVKSMADSLSATITDHSKNISALQATAQSLSSTLSDASGRLSKVEQTAQEHSVTIGNLRSEVEWKQVSSMSLLDTMKSAGHFWGTGKTFTGKPGHIKDTDQVRVVVEVPSDDSISQILYANNIVWQRSFNGNTWSEWVRSANQSDVDTLQGNITQVKQTADGLTTTLRNAQGDITNLQTTARGLSEQITNAQGDITALQTDVTGIKTTIADHDKNIHTLQADAKTLTDDMEDAQGSISSLQKTATSLDSELKNHDGRISKVEQTASTLTTEFSDEQGHLNRVEQKADSNTATISSISKNAMQDRGVITDTKTSFDSLTQLGTYSIKAIGLPNIPEQHYGTLVVSGSASSGWISQQFIADTTGNVYTRIFSNNAWSAWKQGGSQDAINQVKQTADSNSATIRNVQGDVSTLKQTANGTQQTVANQQGQINDIKTDAAGIHETLTGQGNQIANINVTLNGLNTMYGDVYGDLNTLKRQAQWVTVISAVDLNNVKTPCHEFLKGTVTNAPNESAWWYLTVESSDDGNRVTQTVIADQTNNRYTRQLWDGEWYGWIKDATQTDVTNLSNRITTNSTQITQNKQAIALKADQTTVDNLSGEVNQNKAQLKVQADQISSKVSGIETSLADANSKINNITSNGGGRNLLRNSDVELYGKAYGFGNAILTVDQLEAGETYTMSWYGKVDANATKHKQPLHVYISNDSGDWQTNGTIPYTANEYQRNAFTFTVPKNVTYVNTVTFYLGHYSDDSAQSQHDNDDDAGIGYVKNYMLEKGTVAHDWQPAPEDLTTAIQKNATSIEQNKMAIELKADQSIVSDLYGEVYQNKAQLKVQADQISSKVSSSDFKTLDNKVSGAIAQIDKNATAIDQTNKQISLKADQTIVNNLSGQVSQIKNTATNNSSKLDVMAWQISSKVTSTDVNNIVDKKGYATTDTVQSLITQKADSIEAGITGKLSSGDYGGVILDKNGVTLTSGNTHVYLNGTKGFQIQNGTNDVFHVDSSGNLTMQGNITGGDISGVNFSGDSLTLAGDLKVSGGHIILGDKDTTLATLDRNGISLKDGGLSITDKEGHQTTYIDNDGTFTTTKGVFSGSVTATSLTLTGEDAKIDVAGDFVVDSGGHVTANSITITGGTIDAGNTRFDNFSADNITGGTLSGVVVKAGDEDGFFQTSKDNIYWITNSGESAVIGKGKYVQYPGLNVFDNKAVYLGSWAGAGLNKDGTINDYGGAFNDPKIAIETYGMKRRFDEYSQGGELEYKPLDRNRIIAWVAHKEFLSVESGNGTHVELNPDINYSQFTIQKDNKFGAYFGQGQWGNEINFTPIGGMTVNGNFRVTGAKNAIVNTSQGTVAINAYETAEYYFGDIGEGQTNSNGVAYIGIEKLFNETVNTNIPYQVFLTAYGPGDIWVAQREHNRFVVKSNQPNIKFGWEIKAKRKGYEHTRLQNVDSMMEKPAGIK